VAVANGLDVRRDFPAVMARAAEIAGITLDGPARWVPPPRPAVPPEPARTYPPLGEVADLWGACTSVFDDPEVSVWLRSRALDPGDVADRDLARVLPIGRSLPGWATYRFRPWLAWGNRCVVPIYDADGAMRSVRVRRVRAGDSPKTLPPAGHRTGGLVLADALGRQMLATGARPTWWPDGVPLRVLIAEGEPDYLAAAVGYSDADEGAPAILGLPGSGAWAASLAARIPDGAHVIIATDHDDAGDRYAADVAASLAGRCELCRAGGAA
jgi:hypothetical protein